MRRAGERVRVTSRLSGIIFLVTSGQNPYPASGFIQVHFGQLREHISPPNTLREEDTSSPYLNKPVTSRLYFRTNITGVFMVMNRYWLIPTVVLQVVLVAAVGCTQESAETKATHHRERAIAYF